MAETLANYIDVTKLYDYTKELADLYRDNLQNCDAVASGKLINFPYHIDFQEASLRVFFDLPEYYYYIEEGRGPTRRSEGGALFPAIQEWVRRKNITPTKGDLDSLAWAITKSIHRKGYFGLDHHGKHPLKNALDRAKQTGLIDKIRGAVVDGMGETIKVELNTLRPEYRGKV